MVYLLRFILQKKECSIATSNVNEVANLLENNHIKFKVYGNGIIQQKHFGYGDFQYWLNTLEEKL